MESRHFDSWSEPPLPPPHFKKFDYAPGQIRCSYKGLHLTNFISVKTELLVIDNESNVILNSYCNINTTSSVTLCGRSQSYSIKAFVQLSLYCSFMNHFIHMGIFSLYILNMSSYCIMLSVKASSHVTTILWLYNILCLLFFSCLWLFALCNYWVPLATRYAFIMASTSPMYFYHTFCIFIYSYFVRWKQINWIELNWIDTFLDWYYFELAFYPLFCLIMPLFGSFTPGAIFCNTSTKEGGGYHPLLDFRYKATYSHDFGTRR